MCQSDRGARALAVTYVSNGLSFVEGRTVYEAVHLALRTK
jgi:hypothetical protein